ncbi:MAG: transcriptional repressor LexA [Alphaproteobacteria bacterium]|nr:transcriptional repressor LexA [Alphaproteobacteria bacterium]
MLTPRQSQILNLIISSIEKNGICPSFEEMKNQIGVKSKSGIHAILSALEERKYIRKLPNKARAVEVLKFPNGKQYNQTFTGQNTLQNQQESITYPNQMSMQNENTEVPLLGKIAAGTPIEAISEKNYMIEFPNMMLSKGIEHYALEIEGDSMIEAGIFDGDTVLIEKCQTARDGNIIVALVNREEATLKTLIRKDNKIHLQPENSKYETQIYSPEQVEIQGRLVGLLRKY